MGACLPGLGSVDDGGVLGVGMVFEHNGYVADQPPGIGGGIAFALARGEAQMLAEQHLRLFKGLASLQPVADFLFAGRKGAVVDRSERHQLSFEPLHLQHDSRLVPLLGGRHF